MRLLGAFAGVGLSMALIHACGGSTTGGPPADLVKCAAPGECAITPKSCCGACGSPAADDMTAVLFDKIPQYRSSVCTSTTPCSRCASMPDPNLTAVCRASQCSAIDIRTDAMTACQIDTDCVLRIGSVCCEPCSGGAPYELIALSQAGYVEYKNNQCRPGDGACSKCVVLYPPGFAAKCDPTTKHCAVVKGTADAGTD